MSARKDKGRTHSGTKQLYKDQTGKESRRKSDGKKTGDNRRADHDSERKWLIGSWNVCGSATDNR